jgi:hypothetical protein
MLKELRRSSNIGYDKGLVTFRSEVVLPVSNFVPTKLDKVNFDQGSLNLAPPTLTDPVLRCDMEELFESKIRFLSHNGQRQIEMEDFDTNRQQFAWIVNPVRATERDSSFDQLIKTMLDIKNIRINTDDTARELRMNIRDNLYLYANLRYQYGLWTATTGLRYGEQVHDFLIRLSTDQIKATVDVPNWKYLAANLARTI